jgi:hypothetical protein
LGVGLRNAQHPIPNTQYLSQTSLFCQQFIGPLDQLNQDARIGKAGILPR